MPLFFFFPPVQCCAAKAQFARTAALTPPSFPPPMDRIPRLPLVVVLRGGFRLCSDQSNGDLCSVQANNCVRDGVYASSFVVVVVVIVAGNLEVLLCAELYCIVLYIYTARAAAETRGVFFSRAGEFVGWRGDLHQCMMENVPGGPACCPFRVLASTACVVSRVDSNIAADEQVRTCKAISL
jgi:hypothetical protein